ncbi:MAG TPA: hypothetical protein VLT84_11105 [Acidobacteriota bacterium]|nr:hypothetical protein [Acidobacteriota bacterium]
MRHIQGLRPVTLLAVLATLAAQGCLFSPEQKPPKPDIPFEYAGQFAPEATLLTMLQAYERRDSLKTADVYDVEYTGGSVDPSGIVGNFSFTKVDEVRHVGRLKLDPDIVSVQLDFGNQTTWQRTPADAADPPEWAQIQINFATIRVDDIGASTFESSNQALTYVFKPYQNAPGDTTWTIIRWSEIVTNPPPI